MRFHDNCQTRWNFFKKYLSALTRTLNIILWLMFMLNTLLRDSCVIASVKPIFMYTTFGSYYFHY